MIEFNYLAHKINTKIAQSIPYKGIVVDLGCGTSPYKSSILKLADKYVGVDWPQSFHESKSTNIYANLNTVFPLKESSIDTIVSFQVLEHLCEPDLFFKECFRILKPSGKLYITVPFMWHVHEAPYDFFRFTRHGLHYLAQKNKFKNIQIEENSGFWQMITLKLNYQTARIAKGPLKFLLVPLWAINQTLAPMLDNFYNSKEETVSYTFSAQK